MQKKQNICYFINFLDQDDFPLKLTPLQLNGNIIEREKYLKFLDVVLDEHLPWKKNIYDLLKISPQKC